MPGPEFANLALHALNLLSRLIQWKVHGFVDKAQIEFWLLHL